MAIKDLLPWKREPARLPIRRSPDDKVMSLRRDMNRLFDHFLSETFGLWPSTLQSEDLFRPFDGFTPHIDVRESRKEITVTAELAGMDEDDIEIALHDNALTLSGEKRTEEDARDQRYHLLERAWGSFRRTIHLPVEVDEDRVQAVFENGVLTITLPKTPEAQKAARRITVRKI